MKFKFSSSVLIAALAVIAQCWIASAGSAVGEPAKPGVEIAFTLPKDALVTLVIEDAHGNRIRNLIAELPLKAGQQSVIWDLLDENGQLAPVGDYKWRGLYRDPLKLAYQFSAYTGGASIPWFTEAPNVGQSSGWLSDHNPAVAACAVGDKIFVGAVTCENGQDIMALDLDGKKLWGRAHLNSVGASVLASDGVMVYAAGEGQWAGRNAYVFQIDPATYQYKQIWQYKDYLGLRGLAARAGQLVISSDQQQKLFFLDLATNQLVREVPLPNPGGVAFMPDGALLAISGTSVMVVAEDGGLTPLITDQLTRPNRMAVAPDGAIFISDGPTSWYHAGDDEHNALYGKEDVRFKGDNQVKVFNARGVFLRAIGTPGGRKAGKYDPQAMRCPVGIALDSKGNLWVTEWDMLPKRISVWTREGTLVKEFIGAHKYGGGGALDSGDRTQMVYDGMLFKLDWEKGSWSLDSTMVDIMNIDSVKQHTYGGYAQWPTRIVRFQGKEFFVGGGNWSTDGGIIWKRKGESFAPVAFVGTYQPGTPGELNNGIVHTDDFLYQRMVECVGDVPPGNGYGDVGGPAGKWNGFVSYLMVWVDQNDDGIVQPSEVTFTNKLHHWLTEAYIGPDLSAYVRMPGHRGKASVWRIPMTGINDVGAPVFDLEHIETLLDRQPFSWGDMVVDEAGRLFLSSNPLLGLDAATKKQWSYRNDWPREGTGAPRQRPGLVVGGYGMRGTASVGGDAGTIAALNSNYGQWYLFTDDGLFVATIFGDTRTSPFWGSRFKEAIRGMDVNGASLGQESFDGSFGKTSDGNVYIVAGHPHCSIIQVEGLSSITRIAGTANVTATELLKARSEMMATEQPTPEFTLWKQGAVQAGQYHPAHALSFASKARNFSCWFSYDQDNLYLRALLPRFDNVGTDMHKLFATGEAMVIDLGLNPAADPEREEPAPGDVRLVISRFEDKPVALLYRYRVPGALEPVEFISPTGKTTVDEILTIPQAVISADPYDDRNTGSFIEVKAQIPWKSIVGDFPAPKPDSSLRGDIGMVLTSGAATNVAQWNTWTGAPVIIGDSALEGRVIPREWGIFKLQP